MKQLIRLHRFLGVFVAPAMLFFAISGAWQAFRFQQDAKDGSYDAPAVLETLSHLHMAERLSAGSAWWFKSGQVVLAIAFSLTAVVGLVMAVRFGRPRWLVWVALAAGVALPAGLAVVSLR